MRVPVLNSSHVTAEDEERLRRGDIDISSLGDDGWLLWLGEETSPDDVAGEWRGYSAEFHALLAFVIRAGFKHLRLDADGEVLPQFTIFDW